MHIHLVSPDTRFSYATAMDEVFRLRHRVFNEWLGWDLPSEGGLERDCYDEAAYHFIAFGDDQSVLGTWRIMPTTGVYMTKESFPELFGDREAPQDESVWDLSRFAVDRWKLENNKPGLHRVMGGLGSAVFEFAIIHGIAELLSVQDSVITPIANQWLGDPVWHGPTLDAGTTDATCYGYEPKLERLFALRAQFKLNSPVIEQFQVFSQLRAA